MMALTFRTKATPSTPPVPLYPLVTPCSIMPTGFMMALTFQTGNSAYLYLTVAFVQVG